MAKQFTEKYCLWTLEGRNFQPIQFTDHQKIGILLGPQKQVPIFNILQTMVLEIDFCR